MIIHTRIKDKKITIPEELIEKYNITENKLVILMDVGDGILIKPTSYEIPKEVSEKVKPTVENDIEAIISEIIKQQQMEKETVVK